MVALPQLVKDIVPGLSSSNPENLAVFNNKVFFSAFTSATGQELWVTDGTEAGTQLVRDINPGSVGAFGVGSSSPKDFFVFNGKLFFTADDGSTGQELWVTDGTTAGTQLVKDIRPGTASSTESPFYSPAEFTIFNDRLFFSANDGSTGRELWSTDGTTAGTQLFNDIFPGIANSSPAGLTVFNGKLIFAAANNITGGLVWSSDGTAAGTQLLKNISARSSSIPANFTIFGNKLFFTAGDFDTTGTELWVTDGTTAGTQLFKDINPGGFGSSPQNLTVVNGKLFFSANDGTNGQELWISDGTAGGTQLVKDIYPFVAPFIRSSNPANLTVFNGKVYFSAEDDTNGRQVWSSDGTAAGTQLLKNLTSGYSGSVNPMELAVFDGKLFIGNRSNVWVSDGTTAGTQVLSDIFFSEFTSSPQRFTVLGDKLLFTADALGSGSRPGTGIELWKIDATTPSLTIAPTNADLTEGNNGATPFTFTVTRSGDISDTSSVQYAVAGSGSSPTNAADFDGATTGNIQFAANQATATITLNVRGDATIEPDENFTVTLSNPIRATITTATATGIIRDDDLTVTPPATPSLTIASSNADRTEGNSGTTSFTFTITRSGNLSATSSVQYAVTASGTNPANATDFGNTLPTGTVDFAINQATATVTVNVNGDTTIEPDEDFTVTLSNPVVATIATATATGIIRDDDSAIIPTPPTTPTPPAPILTVNDTTNVFTVGNTNDLIPLLITLVQTNGTSLNELGVFKVDNEQGAVNGVAPGANGYVTAALSRSEVVFSTLANRPNGFSSDAQRILELTPGDRFRFYLVQNGTTDSVQAGRIGSDRVILSTVQIASQGNNTFQINWEDGINAATFPDLIVQVQPTTQPAPIAAGLQGGSQAEVFDLRRFQGEQIRAEFSIYREAGFDNLVGFYRVNDAGGSVTDSLTGATIAPGQAGYTQAALRARVPGVELTADNQSTNVVTSQLTGGSILAPFIIANGRIDALLDSDTANDPAIYFPYLGANSDRTDHIRLLADNTFGFEDLPGGGDFDYNDMIIKTHLSVI